MKNSPSSEFKLDAGSLFAAVLPVFFIVYRVQMQPGDVFVDSFRCSDTEKLKVC